jgi:hypothetical protein
VIVSSIILRLDKVKFEIGFSARTLNDFILTHIFMYTSTIITSYILDPGLAYQPCSGSVTCEM